MAVCIGGVRHDRVAVGGVAALVGPRLEPARDEPPVGTHGGFEFEFDRVAGAGAGEGLLAGKLDLDRAPAHLHRQKGVERLVEDLLLIAEAAADIGLDHADLPPRDAERLPADAADDVGNLGGGDDDDPSLLHVGVGDGLLDVAMLDRLGVVFPLEYPQGRVRLHDLVEVPLADREMAVRQQVVGVLLMNGPRAGRERLPDGGDGRVLLVFHADEPRGAGSGHLVLRDDRGDVVAVDAHPPVKQHAVGDVLVRGLYRPGMAGGGVLDLRRIEAGDDLHHAGDLLGLREVEGFHQPVGDRAAHDLGDQAVRGAQIVGVPGPAGHLLICVHAGDALPDSHKTSLLADKLEGQFIT